METAIANTPAHKIRNSGLTLTIWRNDSDQAHTWIMNQPQAERQAA
jgi:hypothetical protein